MKQVPWLRLIILLATLTVIGTFTLWYEFEHKPTTEIKQENEKKILPLADKNIASVEITGKKNRFIIICAETENKNLCQADKNAKWEIQFPKKLTADSNKLRSILSALKGLDAVEKIDLSKESSLKKKALLKSYHLDEESLKNDKRNEITLKLEDGNTYSIFLGQKHPITFQYFLLLKSNDNLDTNTVYLVSAAIEKHFEQTLTFWRDKKIFDFQSNQIQSFTLLFDKDSFQGNQKSNRWILDSFKSSTLKNIEGDAELIERYLSSLSYLNTREFHPDTILKGKNKTATLTLNFEKNKKIDRKSVV